MTPITIAIDGFSSTGKEETRYLNYFTNETGVIFKKDQPYIVESIVKKYPLQWFNYFDFWNDLN